MTPLPFLSAALAAAQSSGQYNYEPFHSPAPLWSWWYLLLLPLCLAIAIVYKSIRCRTMARVPKEALETFAFIIVVMVLAAGALAALVTALDGY